MSYYNNTCFNDVCPNRLKSTLIIIYFFYFLKENKFLSEIPKPNDM